MVWDRFGYLGGHHGLVGESEDQLCNTGRVMVGLGFFSRAGEVLPLHVLCQFQIFKLTIVTPLFHSPCPRGSFFCIQGAEHLLQPYGRWWVVGKPPILAPKGLPTGCRQAATAQTPSRNSTHVACGLCFHATLWPLAPGNQCRGRVPAEAEDPRDRGRADRPWLAEGRPSASVVRCCFPAPLRLPTSVGKPTPVFLFVGTNWELKF